MKKICVQSESGKKYNILIDHNILNQIGLHIKKLNIGNSAFIITSPKIGKLYLTPIVNSLKKSGIKDISINLVPDGERYKNEKSWIRLTGKIVQFNKTDDKKIFVLNLGGGVIGDLGGFVASTYNRGSGYIQVPTTLLAFVDCGIGGKVGVNFASVKNVIGSFYQPQLVYADLDLLKTLNKRELKSGLAEVVKYGVISSPELFKFLEDHLNQIFSLDKKAIQKIVIDGYSIKADLVKRDEFDKKNIRIVLNYGHTIGHAVESASKYAYRHGEAISIGMVCANDIAVKLGLLDKSVADRIENLLLKIGLPVKIKNHNINTIMHFFWKDKKFVNGKNKFVLLRKLGTTKIVQDIPIDVITDIIKNRFTK